MQTQVPKYELVAETLQQEIQDGVFAEGTLLPTEAQLAARFGVSRHTVRHSLRALRELGLVDSRQGRGTEVVSARAPISLQWSHHPTGFAASPFDWTFRLQESAIVAAEDFPEIDFGRPGSDRLLMLTGSFFEPGPGGHGNEAKPAQIFLDSRFAGVAKRFAEGRLPDLIASQHGVGPERVLQDIVGEPAGHPQEGDAGLGRLVLIRRYFDPEGLVYLALKAVCPPSDFHLHSRCGVWN